MFRILVFLLVGIVVLFVVKLVRLMIKFRSINKTTIDDLRNAQSELKKKKYDIEEADFREIPPEEDEKSN